MRGGIKSNRSSFMAGNSMMNKMSMKLIGDKMSKQGAIDKSSKES